MMKHLKIEVNGQEWVNGEFVEITFTDGPNGIKIEGRTAQQQPAGTSKLVQMLSEAVKKQTEQTDAMVEDRKAELAAEKKARHRADTPVIVAD